MRRFAAVLAVLLLPAVGWGQSVELPVETKGDVGVFVIVKAKTDCAELKWVALDAGLSMIPSDLLKDSRTAVVMAGRAGRYRLLAYGALKDRASEPSLCTVVIGEAPPVPPGPVPPGPNPPGPTPTPVAGLRVLIVEEAMERTKLPAAQVMVILGQPMRDYLNKVCMADPAASSGKSWGIWDKDSDASGMPQPWQTMFAKGKTLTMPAIVIAGPDGNPVFTGPLPANVADAQSLINRFVPQATPAKRKAA